MSIELFENMLLRNSDDKTLYRVLWLSEDRQLMYLFNITTMSIPEVIPCSEVQRRISEGIIAPQSDDPYIRLVAESELSEKEQTARDNIWALMSDAVANEPDIYVRKPRAAILANIVAKSGKQLKTLYDYLKIYWKHGKRKNAFLPNYGNCGAPGKERTAAAKKRGRPRKYDNNVGVNADEATKTIFEKAIKKYYHTRDGHTLKYAYDMMIAEHYVGYITLPDGAKKAEPLNSGIIPTIEQFRYWYHKMHSDKETITKRKGATKFELEHRAITGKSDFGIMGPGAKYQIDATVGDVYLVSRFNRADIIGRPVIYFIIDVFSRMVTGMYVGLEGPSWAGAMMALANAMSDKVKYCAEYGVVITPEEWPCFGVPGAILGDRGEMESKSVETMINTLNVRVENAPPYRGDMKGIVEQYFNITNETALFRLPGHVKPDMAERGGKDYRLDAKLDIHQLTKILIQCVLHHNNHHLLETYERTSDMIADGVVPIPLEIWNWGITHLSGALRSFPEDKIKLALMPADTASVTAKGVRYRNIYYLCDRAVSEYWFERARSKGAWKIDISFDPRNMSTIYIRNTDGTVEKCWLSEWQDKYGSKSLDEILHLLETEKSLGRKNASKEMASKAELSAAIDSVISEAEEMARQTAVPKSKAERTKNIRDNRRSEKTANRLDEAFEIGDYGEPEMEPGAASVPESESKSEEIHPMLAMIKQQLEERLNEK
jgi:hypothetical protein